jgi:hypothetical protein
MNLIDQENLQLGICLMTCLKGERWHAHGLLIGRNRYGKTLADCNRGRWENDWDYLAKIKNVHNKFGAVEYFSQQYLSHKSNYAEVDFFNFRLLRRTMREMT